jgi:UPF0755 protein
LATPKPVPQSAVKVKPISSAKRVTLQFMGIIWASMLVFFGVAIGGGLVFRVMGPGPLMESVTVVIPKGASVRDMAYQLDEAGAVKHWLPWWLLTRLMAEPGQLKAGEYAIPARASLWTVMDILRSGNVIIHKVTVPEGRTSYEIVAMLKAEPLLVGEVNPLPPEGSLLPETYFFQRGDTRGDIVARMKTNMEQLLSEVWDQRYDDLPYSTPQEAITMASIVEKETGIDAERPQIAGVFVNRLRQGMKLQSDPTTIYALTGGKGSIQDVLGRQLVRSDWKLENPYNTYHITGLPPGPIANPGKASIMAALKPAKTDAIFFVADGKGGHTFTKNLSEHNKNVNKLINGRDEPAAKAPVKEAETAKVKKADDKPAVKTDKGKDIKK